MGRFDDDVVADLQCRFSEGETPTWEEFYEWIDDIQAGFDAHNHSGAGSGDGAAIPFSALSGLIEYENIRDKTGASAIVAFVNGNAAAIGVLQGKVTALEDAGFCTEDYADGVVATHSGFKTGVHQAGTGAIAMMADIGAHNINAGAHIALETAWELYADGAAASAASAAVSTHSGLKTGVHQVGESWLASLADLGAHNLDGGAHLALELVWEAYADGAASAAASSAVSTHSGLKTGVHQVGASWLASLADIGAHNLNAGAHIALETAWELYADGAIATALGDYYDADEVDQFFLDSDAYTVYLTGLNTTRIAAIELDYLVALDLSTHADETTGVHGAGSDYLVTDAITDALDDRVEDNEDDIAYLGNQNFAYLSDIDDALGDHEADCNCYNQC